MDNNTINNIMNKPTDDKIIKQVTQNTQLKTSDINEKIKKEKFKICEVINNKIILNFKGYRLSLENHGNHVSDEIEIEYKDKNNGFDIINYK